MTSPALLEAPTSTEAVMRVRAAYVAQPALSLTVLQARRLFDLDLQTADDVLHLLLEERFLVSTDQAQFVRPR